MKNNKTRFYKENSYEPKKEHRFFVEFPSDWDIPKWATHYVSPISRYQVDKNDYTWENIIFKLHDPVCPSIPQRLMKKQTKFPNVLIHINKLGPVNDVVERWELVGDIVRCDFGNLDYDSDQLNYITIEYKPRAIFLEY